MHYKHTRHKQVNRVFLLNTPILAAYGQYDFSGPLNAAEVKQYLEAGFESAIGHEATAQFMQQLLGIDIPLKRQAVKLSVGDIAVIFRLTQRLPEGLVINSAEEFKDYPYEFSLLKRLA
ncbi:MAG: hypothetical protein ACJAS1_004516 [Oleiphilaceae bacterium]|jgi:hypothetical protein